MESDDEQDEPRCPIPNLSDLFNKLVLLQADFLYNALAFLFSPISTSLSLLSEAFHRAEDTKHALESAAQQAPSHVAHGATLLLRRLCYGFLGAALMCVVTVAALVAAGAVAGGLVWLWSEEPVALREALQFDYTQRHPKTVFGVELDGEIGVVGSGRAVKGKHLGIPVGHTYCVSVVLFMPESDFNREVGVFQLSAALVSTSGDVLTASTQPCMLRFRSAPIRLTRTFLLAIPFLLGLSEESQTLTIPTILSHTETRRHRSASIHLSLIPRFGTSALPQLYGAQILVLSQPPWPKQLLHRWKWTFFLWLSLLLFLLFLAILLVFFRPISFFEAAAMAEAGGDGGQRAMESEEEEEGLTRDEMAEITAELLRKWQEIRRKKKAAIFARTEVELGEEYGASSVSSITFDREVYVISQDFEEDDLESVCSEGSEG